MGNIESNKDLILHLFLTKLYSCNMIARKLTAEGTRCSRQGVVLALQSWGIDTSKAVAGWVDTTCGYAPCGRKFKVKRNYYRKRVLEDGLKTFCCMDHAIKHNAQ